MRIARGAGRARVRRRSQGRATATGANASRAQPWAVSSRLCTTRSASTSRKSPDVMPSRSAPRNGSAVSISSALISSALPWTGHALAVRQDRRLRLLVDHLDQGTEPHADPRLGSAPASSMAAGTGRGSRRGYRRWQREADPPCCRSMVDQAHADPGPLGHRMGGRRDSRPPGRSCTAAVGSRIVGVGSARPSCSGSVSALLPRSRTRTR